MLPQHLNTNEIKDRTGAEKEFLRTSNPQPLGGVEFLQSGLAPAYPTILRVKHDVRGTGLARSRRTVQRFDKTFLSSVDSASVGTITFYQVAVIPEGLLTNLNDVTDVQSFLMSFIASRGATTTILYDGTGCGAEVAINGTA